jgi:hypothetical protein
MLENRLAFRLLGAAAMSGVLQEGMNTSTAPQEDKN